MSILTHLHQHPKQCPRKLHFIYSARIDPSGNLNSILFFERLHKIFTQESLSSDRLCELFLTDPIDLESLSANERDKITVQRKLQVTDSHPQRIRFRRFVEADLLKAIGPIVERSRTVAYVCGPRAMTDLVVDILRKAEGMPEERVLCEKWW